MKLKITLLGVVCLLTTYTSKAQESRSIISPTAVIKTYHYQSDLKKMKKGELLDLYVERIQVLVKTLPYIALVTKPGITMEDIGIPKDNTNKKTFDTQAVSTETYLGTTIDFQQRLLPYADTDNIIAAILFYEQTLKSLQSFDELKQ